MYALHTTALSSLQHGPAVAVAVAVAAIFTGAACIVTCKILLRITGTGRWAFTRRDRRESVTRILTCGCGT